MKLFPSPNSFKLTDNAAAQKGGCGDECQDNHGPYGNRCNFDQTNVSCISGNGLQGLRQIVCVVELFKVRNSGLHPLKVSMENMVVRKWLNSEVS